MSRSAHNDKRIPVIIIHVGSSTYLRTAISALCKLHSFRVILIGDEYSKNYADEAGIEYFSFTEYNDEYWNKNHLGYKHTSYLPEKFERFCFERFNVLNKFAQAHNIPRFVHLDSDILILNPKTMDMIISNLIDYDFSGLSSWSSYFSGWSLDVLQQFITWLPEYFCGPPGGDRYCDIFALKLFIETQEKLLLGANVAEHSLVYNSKNYTFDPNYSIVPLLMKHENEWDYASLQQKNLDLSKFISSASGHALYKYECNDVTLDFVHLNGYTKNVYDTFFSCFIKELAVSRQQASEAH